MVCVILMLSVLLMAICVIGIVLIVKDGFEEEVSETDVCATEAARREREREAHYMRNFWQYDGSEQQDWDEG